MKKITLANTILSMFLCVVLLGCGFHLRGLSTDKLSKRFEQAYLDISETNNEFYQEVKKLIIDNGGDITNKDSAKITVILSPVVVNYRQVAIADNNSLKEYEYNYRVNVSVLDEKNSQLGSSIITTVKNIQLNDNQVTINEEYLKENTKEVYQELAKSTLHYLQSF